MTQEKLIVIYGGLTLTQLEAMSDQQVEEHFSKYFKVTRPTKKLESKVVAKGKKPISKVANKLAGMTPEQLEKLKQMREQYGIS